MAANYITAEEAVQLIKSGDRVFIHGSAATPVSLVNTLFKRAGSISNVELVSISSFGNIDWDHPGVMSSFRMNSLFVSENVREWVNGNGGQYVPIFLSEIPNLFNRRVLPLNAAIVQVSPPDQYGYCTLGTAVDAALSAVRNAEVVIAQVNPRMPRVLGDGVLHISKFSALVWEESQLPEINYAKRSTGVIDKIGRYVAGLIEDGSTLQVGIGSIPDAVLKHLSGHKGLGIHTETFSDGILPLVANGVITNEHKKVFPGKIISSFIIGTRKVYDFVDNNPFVNCMDVAFVNDSDVIRRNPKVISINSAIEVDMTGQICADSIGTYQYSGIGGQLDFMRGAALSDGGKPIIALPSTTKDGISRIVPFLRPGAGVVTTRGHVHYVVTEYGVVNLYGKNMEQRARLLISIAHPDHREKLEIAYHKRFDQVAGVARFLDK
jgi:acyl-CoA hydrolase